MKRIYDSLLEEHLANQTEMLFLTGPRQVGKTTTSKQAQHYCSQFTYLNWDNEDHRNLLLSGPSAIFQQVQTQHNQLTEEGLGKAVVVFDEIHKRPDWKNFLKGFFDTYGKEVQIIVTGSARLDLYKKGGDSLMGRYFPYRMHPLSVAECLRTDLSGQEINPPLQIDEDSYRALYKFGGFPKPFVQQSSQFTSRWQNLKTQQLLQEDIRDVNVIHDLNRLRILMDLLKNHASHQITYSNLAKFTRSSVDTIRRWIEVLEAFYYCYRIKPWSKNISRSLLKEPKVYLWDWSIIKDIGSKTENFIASHLLKATHYWTDRGFGEFELFYIRTLDKKEVDFLVSKNGEAWFLVEVKHSNSQKISPYLSEFQNQTGAPHAFQVVFDLPYVEKNCFSTNSPTIVPAKTFLSQLV